MSESKKFRFSRLVARNLANRPYRNLATVFAYALIAATLFSSQFLMSGAQQSLDLGISRMGADILVVPEEYAAASQTVILTGIPTTFFFEDSGFERITQIPGVERASPQIYIATLFASCCAAPVQIIAIDSERDFTIGPWLKNSSGIKLGKDEIIIGSAVIQDVGKDLMFYGHTFHVVGELEQTGMGIDNAVFTRFEDAYVMADESEKKAVKKLVIPRGFVSAVLVKVDPAVSASAVAQEIQAQVPGTKTILPNGLLSAVSDQLGAVTLLLNGSVVALTIVFLPLLGLLSAMIAYERRREVSILRALGARNTFIMKLVLAESFAIAIIGGLCGIGAAAGTIVLFQEYITYSLNIPFVIPAPLAILEGAGSALLLSVLIGGISALYPVLLITSSEPYETIRKGES